jgi:hypothetical protein
MRKILIVSLMLILVVSTGAFAAKGSGLAIGGEGALYFGGTGGLPMGAMLTLHLPQFPLMLAIGVSTPLAIGMTADYWFSHGSLVTFIDWYAGVGGYLALDFDPSNVAVGARIPLALQVWPFGQTLEFFIEVAPAVGIGFIPTAFWWHLQGALGFRIWF